MLPREYGFEIGLALESRKYGRAQTLLQEAYLHGSSQKTIRDYSEPLEEIMTSQRVLNVLDSIDVLTVEDFMRTPNSEMYEASAKIFAPRREIDREARVVESKYSERLYPFLSDDCVAKFHMEDVLCCADVDALTDPELRKALGYHAPWINEALELQRTRKNAA